MNIIYSLLNKFFLEETTNTALMIIISLTINILQTNGISFITAKIIEFVQINDQKGAIVFYKYFIIISIIFIILYTFYKHIQNLLLTKLRQWMRHQLVKVLLQVNNENFSEINFTKLNSPINRISSISFMVFNDIITYVLPNIMFLLIVSLYFFYKNKIFGIGFLTGNLIIIAYLYFMLEDMLNHNDEYEKYVGDTESYLQEILNNIDKIIYRGEVNNEIDKFSDKTANSINKAYLFYSNTNLHGFFMISMVFIIIFVSVIYLIRLYFTKKIDITIFITFFTILLLYRDKIMTIIQQIPDFIEFLGRSDSVLKHFKDMDEDYKTMNDKEYAAHDLPFKNIRFENVEFQYKSSKTPVFDNLNMNLNTDGKIIGITGLSGNGKSTLVKLILRLYKCKKGAIYIDGENIKNIDPVYIRSNMVYVNQSSKLFDKKIVENMLYGCSDKNICQDYLDKIMKYDKIRELYRKMDIYDKQAGALGENLSGGQRQVVNIISGLVSPSKILILDEPTNALDMDLKQEILKIIREFRKYKQCIIIITHDRDVYRLFDETVTIGGNQGLRSLRDL